MTPLKINWEAVEAFGTWVGGVIGGLSLLLAFYILLRDRRRDDQRQAEDIGYTFDWEKAGSGKVKAILTVHNTSDFPIRNVGLACDFVRLTEAILNPSIRWALAPLKKEIYEVGANWRQRENWSSAHSQDAYTEGLTRAYVRSYLLEGRFVHQSIGEPCEKLEAKSEITIEGTTLLPSEIYLPRMEFRDAKSREWERDIRSGNLRRRRNRGGAIGALFPLSLLAMRLRWRWKTGTWKSGSVLKSSAPRS